MLSLSCTSVLYRENMGPLLVRALLVFSKRGEKRKSYNFLFCPFYTPKRRSIKLAYFCWSHGFFALIRLLRELLLRIRWEPSPDLIWFPPSNDIYLLYMRAGESCFFSWTANLHFLAPLCSELRLRCIQDYKDTDQTALVTVGSIFRLW